MKKRKITALLLIALTLAAGLAACSRGDSGSGGPPSPEAQELVIGDQFDLGGFDPAGGMLDDAQILAYNALIELDADFKQVPALAESWEMSADGKTWTFHLRSGVTFHDGEPFDSAAALVNFQTRLAGWPAAAAVETYETPDANTLICKLKQPSYAFASDIARTAMSMASPKAINEDGTLAYEAGTGPYKLAGWTPDVEYTFEAYDGYWGGPVNLQKITFKVVADAQARAMALEAGEIDMMSGYQSLAAIKRLTDDPRFTMFIKTQNTSGAIYFNLERVPDLSVRAAVAKALDFGAMLPSLLPGLVTPPSGFFSPAYGELVSPDAGNPAYDPAAIPALLEAGGYSRGADGIWAKDGAPLALTLTYSTGNSEDSLLAPAIQAQLAEAGLALTLNGVDGATLGDLLDRKEYDLALTGQSFIPTDDTVFHYAEGYWHTGSYYNIYSTPEIDALIDELAVSLDRERRKELNWKIQEKIMEQVPVIMVYHRNSIRLAWEKVSGFDIGAGCWHVNYDLKNAKIN
ncbi:MAG: ABC transporter substrate-binding protein [Gracilibacteraceae bacterium]|jgi:peptide/nickel transport system substrate-binding protein|nr:ABC transporter substrate-binding protein [Gracilibacteraceae bacterium]